MMVSLFAVCGCLLVAFGGSSGASQKGRSNYALSTSLSSSRSLNNWLSRNVESSDPEENLQKAIEKLNSIGLFDGSLVPEINALKELSEATECNSDVLGVLRYVQVGVEQFKDDQERVKRIVTHLARPELIGDCERFIDRRAVELTQSVDNDKAGVFIRLMKNYVNDNYFQGFKNAEARHERRKQVYVDYLLKDKPDKYDIGGVAIVRLINQLAELFDPTGEHSKFYEVTKNSKTGKQVVLMRDYASFARAFDQYLVEPCKHYLAVMGNFFESSLVLPLINLNGQEPEESRVAFMGRRSADFQDALHTHKSCKVILMMGENKPRTLKPVFDRFFPK